MWRFCTASCLSLGPHNSSGSQTRVVRAPAGTKGSPLPGDKGAIRCTAKQGPAPRATLGSEEVEDRAAADPRHAMQWLARSRSQGLGAFRLVPANGRKSIKDHILEPLKEPFKSSIRSSSGRNQTSKQGDILPDVFCERQTARTVGCVALRPLPSEK